MDINYMQLIITIIIVIAAVPVIGLGIYAVLKKRNGRNAVTFKEASYNFNENTGKNAIISEITENNSRLEKQKKDCYSEYQNNNLTYEKRKIINKEFAGDGGVIYYINYFIDFCTNKLSVMTDPNSIMILVYNNIFCTVQRKINNVNDEINKISIISREEFYNEYNLDSSVNIPDLPTLDNDELKKVNQQIITQLKKINGISEELNSRQSFYKNDISGQKYESAYYVLKKIQFSDYDKIDDVKTYKAKLFELADELKKL